MVDITVMYCCTCKHFVQFPYCLRFKTLGKQISSLIAINCATSGRKLRTSDNCYSCQQSSELNETVARISFFEFQVQHICLKVCYEFCMITQIRDRILRRLIQKWMNGRDMSFLICRKLDYY